MARVIKMPPLSQIWARLWLAGLGLLGLVLAMQFAPFSAATQQSNAASTLWFNVQRQPQFANCLTLTWAVEGVRSIAIDQAWREPQGSEEKCNFSVHYQPRLDVYHHDGSSQIVVLRQRSAVLDWLAAVMIASAAGLLLAGAFLLYRPAGMIAAGLLLTGVGGLIVSDYMGLIDILSVIRLGAHMVWVPAAAMLLTALRCKPQHPNWVWLCGLLSVIFLLIPFFYGIPYGLVQSSLPNQGRMAAAIVYGIPWLLALLALLGANHSLKHAFANTMIGVIGMTISFALVEVILRAAWSMSRTITAPMTIAVPKDEESIKLRPNVGWFSEYPSNPRGYFDSENRVYYRSNSDGFRDTTFLPERNPNRARIAIVGDSFAMGLGVHAEDRLDVVMEATFAEKYGCVVEVYNYGVNGNNSADYVQVVQTAVLDAQPDILLMWYFLNDIDITKSDYFEDALQQHNPYYPLERTLSDAMLLLSQRLQRLAQARVAVANFNAAYADGEQWLPLQSHLNTIAQTARDNNINYGLFVHPILVQLDENHPYQAIHEQVLQTADSFGYFTDDLLIPLSTINRPAQALWVHPVDSHPNDIANRETARYTAKRLLPYLPQCQPSPVTNLSPAL
jgi:hypothetical protein